MCRQGYRATKYFYIGSADAVEAGGKQHDCGRDSLLVVGSPESKNHCMHRTTKHENREIHWPPITMA